MTLPELLVHVPGILGRRRPHAIAFQKSRDRVPYLAVLSDDEDLQQTGNPSHSAG
jgi:hypothetical protein